MHVVSSARNRLYTVRVDVAAVDEEDAGLILDLRDVREDSGQRQAAPASCQRGMH